MNFNSRDIVPLNGSARTTDPPPESGRDSTDRNASGRASSASDRIYIDARSKRASFPPSDYPPPRALANRDVFDWYDDLPLVDNAAGFGNCLAEADDLYRATSYGDGLILASTSPHHPPPPKQDAALFAAVIADRQPVRVIKKGNITANSIPPSTSRPCCPARCSCGSSRRSTSSSRSPATSPTSS
ncbi:MAG: hypothetical protein WKF75_14455 [Singulisphaera sp.]